jgi:hypothetical protein
VQPRAVEQRCDQPAVALEPRQHGPDLLARLHHWQAPRSAGAHQVIEFPDLAAQHVAVQEEQNAGNGADRHGCPSSWGPKSPSIAAPENGEAPPFAARRGLSVASRKPDPVVGGHPSGLRVAARLVRPIPGSFGRATLGRSPIWPCTGRGLPSRPVARTAGELLPHRFTLARTAVGARTTPPTAAGGLLSVALSLGFRRLDVIQRPALQCPDFPRREAWRAPWSVAARPRRGHLACLASIPPVGASTVAARRARRGREASRPLQDPSFRPRRPSRRAAARSSRPSGWA